MPFSDGHQTSLDESMSEDTVTTREAMVHVVIAYNVVQAAGDCTLHLIKTSRIFSSQRQIPAERLRSPIRKMSLIICSRFLPMSS